MLDDNDDLMFHPCNICKARHLSSVCDCPCFPCKKEETACANCPDNPFFNDDVESDFIPE